MPKLIVISAESSLPNEVEIVREMFSIDSSFRFHLRKPNWTKGEFENFLNKIETKHYPRISIHNHLELKEVYQGVSPHFTEKMRRDKKGKSTSFHSKVEADKSQSRFDYFFCSPVFESISKKEYTSNETWYINDWPIHQREKAVALGGMTADNIETARNMGFQNFAFLGSIWLSKDPIHSFKTIFKNVK